MWPAVLRGGVFGCLLLGCFGLIALRADHAYPPPIPGPDRISREVLAHDGQVLRVFANPEGRFRMACGLGDVDSAYLDMLVAYEDKRFYRHPGIDALALTRAAWQIVRHGRIVSGGSTITMQVARLIEPRRQRSLSAKLRQMARALQLERRFSKEAILDLYLTLAPFGGNLEGACSASLAWFGKPANHLTVGEAALLVALPQSPEARRPDRNPGNAASARLRVLERIARAGIVAEGEVRRVAGLVVPSVKRAMPALAPHVADRALAANPDMARHETTLDAAKQARLERLAKKAAQRIGPKVSVALVAADRRSGAVLASVGSAGYFDASRSGSLDMTLAPRSPGSTLKPIIYAMAIEEGLVLPQTVIADRSIDFNGYRPANFEGRHEGEVTVREALRQSLNGPAVLLLDALGPARLLARLQRAGVRPIHAGQAAPGLSLALGGASLSLRDLVQLYANLGVGGLSPISLGDGIGSAPGQLGGPRMVSKVSAWHVGDMLSGMPGASGLGGALPVYKTGTSYGHRDAWAIGFDGATVIGVWVGRADNGVVPGITGGRSAAPILLEAFMEDGQALEALPSAPAGAVRLSHDQLPPSKRRFDASLAIATGSALSSRDIGIAFPRPKSVLEMVGDREPGPVIVKVAGGTPPFRLIANGVAEEGFSRRRELVWKPEGPGSHRLSVIDGRGQAASVGFTIAGQR